MAKSDYYDDPEAYWEERKDRKEQDGKEALQRWERQNPHLPYGYRIPSYPEE